jgi:hypothetical protein
VPGGREPAPERPPVTGGGRPHLRFVVGLDFQVRRNARPLVDLKADGAAALGIDHDQLTSINTTKVYGLYGIDLDSIADLRFE